MRTSINDFKMNPQTQLKSIKATKYYIFFDHLKLKLFCVFISDKYMSSSYKDSKINQLCHYCSYFFVIRFYIICIPILFYVNHITIITYTFTKDLHMIRCDYGHIDCVYAYILMLKSVQCIQCLNN